MKNISLAFFFASAIILGCAASAPEQKKETKQIKHYKYKITQFYGGNDLAIRSKTFLTDRFLFEGPSVKFSPWNQVEPIYLMGTVEILPGQWK